MRNLSFEKQFFFGLFCSERCIDCYKPFDRMVMEENLQLLTPDGNGYKILKKILDFSYELANKKKTVSPNIVNDYIETCYSIAPSDEDYGDIETTIAQFVANCVAYSLKFYVTEDLKYINWCSDSLIEILNISESDKFNKTQPNESADIMLKAIFEKEVELQMEIITRLKNDINPLDLRKFVENHKLGT